MNIFATFLLCGLMLFLSHQVLHDRLKTGELMAVMDMVGSLLPSVPNLALLSIPINEARIAFNRMYELAGIKQQQNGHEEVSDFKHLEVKDISFRYPGRSPIQQNGAAEFMKTTIPNLFVKQFNEEHKPIVDELIAQGNQFTADTLIAYYTAMINRPNRSHILQKATVPVLFFIGEEDIAVTSRCIGTNCTAGCVYGEVNSLYCTHGYAGSNR